MKFLHLSLLCVAIVLAGCSSGSSSPADSTVSANTADTQAPADDQAGLNDNDNSENDSSDASDTEQGAGTENSVDTSLPQDNQSDSEDSQPTDQTETVPNTVDQNPDANTDTENPNDSVASGEADPLDNGEATDTPSADTPIGAFSSRVRVLTLRTLVGLSQSLSQGELLSDQQQQCLGSYEPGFGEPLMAISCDTALATGSVPIYASIASVNDTPECRASLQSAVAEGIDVDKGFTTACTVNQAKLTVRTRWNLPDVGPGQPQRPQPDAGAEVSYAIDGNQLRLENLADRLSGVFNCQFDLMTGESTSSACDDELLRITNLIDSYLP